MNLMAEATRTDLSDLVRNRREELGLSLRQVEAASTSPGADQPRVRYGWLSKLERNVANIDVPTLVQLEGLAAGLRLPLPAIQDHAAAQFFGIEPDSVWSKTAEARVMVAHMDGLSEEDRRDLLNMAELFVKRRTPHGAEDS